MNPKALLILLAVALVTILALVSVLLSGAGKSAESCSSQPQHGNLKANVAPQKRDKGSVFSDLTPEEFSATVDYLKRNLGKKLVNPADAKPSENCIYYVDVKYPQKQQVLDYLDREGEKPKREALAVVFFGDQEEPNITEYVVGPLPNPSYFHDITLEKYKEKLPYYRRPVIGKEYADAYSFMYEKEFSTAPQFLKALGYDGSNFAALTTTPRGFKSGERRTWFVLFLKMAESCFSVHPVGLEILLDHRSLDVSQWKVIKVFYNGDFFSNMADLEKQFNSGKVDVIKIPKVKPEDDIGSMNPKVSPQPGAPLQFNPAGNRYTVHKNQVNFQSWSFNYGMNVNSGLRLFDIRFNNERIAYEISTQEAMVIYGSNTPGGMILRYLDSSFGIGRFSFELVRGVDCPHLATYIDAHYLMESDTPDTNKNAICIFEQNLGVPLRRHYSNMHGMYYGGLPSTVLIVRAVSTLINYDYVWDFIFYQNGVIEAKIHATGYISSSFYFANGKEYGSRVGEHTLGTIHTHFISYKVDLDVGGIDNSVMTQDMQFNPVNIPWQPEVKIQQPKVVRSVLETENQGAYELHAKAPRYIHFTSNTTNKWGHPRSYRLQIVSFAGDFLPEESPVEKAMGWARYKLAVTKRKEEEAESSSIYNQNDPWSPSVTFRNFINNENIQNQDLVAWITVGFLHIPHSEDLPNTATPGNAVGFLLRPYNYFDVDPSVHSADGVYFQSEQDYGSCDVNHLACLSEKAFCIPKIPPFTYEGFKTLVNL
ncbi:membrane primary amine oxidase-like [Hyla sarda]|uniref:membrane primary amine oxidase-like n=1 Tax=Hyla sarda TaxID=327740 RepID=UPI0024C2D3A6|nr:membrane primary amine oxidase-like [Hyla sarda]